MINRLKEWLEEHSKRLYAVLGIIILLAVGVPVIHYVIGQRVKYDWGYSEFGKPESKQPLGAFYVKQYLKETLGYEVIDDKEKAERLWKSGKCNVVECSNKEIKESYIRRGTNVVYVVGGYLAAYHIKVEANNYFDIDAFREEGDNKAKKAALYKPGGKQRGDAELYLWDNMLNFYFLSLDSKSKRLLVDERDNCYAIRRKMGKGTVTLVGSRFLVSNYALSKEDTRKAFEEMVEGTFDKSKPVYIEYQDIVPVGREYDEPEEESAFTVLLKNPKTALAMYIMVGVLLLFVVMNSRRRRAPVADAPRDKNMSISYVRHIATLYDANSDYKELLIIEQRELLYKLRKDFRFEPSTSDYTLPSQYASLVARTKGWNEEQFLALTRYMEELTSRTGAVSRKEYEYCMRTLQDPPRPSPPAPSRRREGE